MLSKYNCFGNLRIYKHKIKQIMFMNHKCVSSEKGVFIYTIEGIMIAYDIIVWMKAQNI